MALTQSVKPLPPAAGTPALWRRGPVASFSFRTVMGGLDGFANPMTPSIPALPGRISKVGTSFDDALKTASERVAHNQYSQVQAVLQGKDGSYYVTPLHTDRTPFRPYRPSLRTYVLGIDGAALDGIKDSYRLDAVNSSTNGLRAIVGNTRFIDYTNAVPK